MEAAAPVQMNDSMEEYWRLIHAFPLAPIRDDTHLDQALAIIDQLTERSRPDADAQLYLGALADLVYVYEQQHVSWPPVTGSDVVRHLMEEHQLTQADLAPLFGGRSVVSAVLAGKRRLNLTHITRLSARFDVPAGVFIDEGTSA
ncbi:MAG TPA: helix-turn-helix domain-containing protein [Chloroflexota bacterium]|nr:helix-turn-helix domain-containing protein [Chloroflexota bacterium]